jgi:hypothetical protein
MRRDLQKIRVFARKKLAKPKPRVYTNVIVCKQPATNALPVSPGAQAPLMIVSSALYGWF